VAAALDTTSRIAAKEHGAAFPAEPPILLGSRRLRDVMGEAKGERTRPIVPTALNATSRIAADRHEEHDAAFPAKMPILLRVRRSGSIGKWQDELETLGNVRAARNASSRVLSFAAEKHAAAIVAEMPLALRTHLTLHACVDRQNKQIRNRDIEQLCSPLGDALGEPRVRYSFLFRAGSNQVLFRAGNNQVARLSKRADIN
jgi:hypothetical protein